MKKPILKVEGVSKIPVNVRQAYLDRFFEACALVYPDDSDARQRVSIALLALMNTAAADDDTDTIYTSPYFDFWVRN